MSSMETGHHNDLSDLTSIESTISQALNDTADELAHAECFDQEQRAEIYSILEAIRTDSANHQEMVKLLADRLKKGRCPNA